MNGKSRDLKPRTKAFALRVIRMYSRLPRNDTAAQVMGRRVLRSGTSVGANHREASRGRSKAEFVSKVGDCLKEIEETEAFTLAFSLQPSAFSLWPLASSPAGPSPSREFAPVALPL